MRTFKFGITLALTCILAFAAQAQGNIANQMTPVFVELKSPKPTVVARFEAAQRGEYFDEELHRANVRAAQDDYLNSLLISGVAYNLSGSQLANGIIKDHRFTDLVNAIRIEALATDMSVVRNTPNVKHVTRDKLQRLHLNNSVKYIRANGDDSARSMGVRGAGQVNTNGSSTGQAIAILDTGLDHTNAMFDLRFTDDDFECRGRSLTGDPALCDPAVGPAGNGDTRPPRLSGTPFDPAINHPKVAYRYNVNQAPIAGDDTGHGTNSGTTAGGLLALADSVVNSGEIVEGVAPGAVMMDYKVCPSLTCVNVLSLLALEDCINPVDDMGNPKPVCTVVNMSFGSDAGDPYSAHGIAAGNLQYAGTVPVASAGNSGPVENIVGAPSATRTVISVAATNDPGVSPNSIDLLNGSGDNFLAFFAPESNAAQGNITTPITGEYVYVGFGDTPEQYPAGQVTGRICLAERGSTVDGGAAGTGLFGNKAAQCTQNGGIALVIYNNADGQMGSVLAPAGIPVFTTSGEAGAAMLADTTGGVGNDQIRINPADPTLFEPATTGFSSRGPNNDFLVVKPDITAPGEDVLMGGSKIGALGGPTGFTPASGTSFSGPHIAGVAALIRDASARDELTPSQVRAAMMNTATNLRLGDGTEIANDDRRNFIHETGAGLVEVVEALQVAAIMGTNELNGLGGPDDTTDPNFLPSYSFGERAWIDTGVVATDSSQQATITVTMEAFPGGGGIYGLSLVDGGADRGDVTAPIIGTSGFELSLSDTTVNLNTGTATFDVTVAVDGNDLGLVGTDVNGEAATEFLWFVVADNGSEKIRMPMFLRVIEGGAPVLDANNDSASTTPETPVIIDVLDNDTGEGLTVTAVTQPANGSASVNPDDTITYTPNPSFSGGDSFTYEITDSNGASDTATVTVTVGGQCVPTGQYFTDFEADDGGFTFDVAATRATSITWGRTEDPLASTPLSLSMMSDTNNAADLVNPLKDDRLVSPTLIASQDSELVFYHRFGFATGTDGGIDGGVLEVSVNGGAWDDIVGAGGSFNIGGYNGQMRAGGNPGVIPGRFAWTGLSQFIDANTPTTVDLSAFAGQEIQLRWRLTLDSTVVIGDIEGGKGWWIESVQVTNTGCDTPNQAPIARDDAAETPYETSVDIDILANDSDPENDPITLDAISQPPNGTVYDNFDGTVTYDPNMGYSGTDTFSYVISDDHGNEASATVTVEVGEDGGNTGGGCNDADSDSDSDSDSDKFCDEKVKGKGKFIDDNGDEAKFKFNAYLKKKGVKGKLKLEIKELDFKIYADVTSVNVDGTTATFGGVCKDKYNHPCTFEAYVEDNADDGDGADRFQINVTDGVGYSADEIIFYGNIKVY
ncbi:MAG: S8 family serine peptidase [Woeseia sp.]|nr:S8 family serine peptidase [Woeseia sp.]